jgi:heme A synthase
MQSDQRFAIRSIVVIAVSALAAGIGTLSATLGAPLGAILLGEVSGFACVVVFTLLIWAAIQDGKQSDRRAIEFLD